jgi:hypothetical protein
MFTVAVGTPNASSTVNWKVDRDCVFLGCICTSMAGGPITAGPQCNVSLRNDFTTAFWVQAGVGGAPIVGGVLFSAGPQSFGMNSVRIPVAMGETIFVSFQLGGWALLVFDELAS